MSSSCWRRSPALCHRDHGREPSNLSFPRWSGEAELDCGIGRCRTLHLRPLFNKHEEAPINVVSLQLDCFQAGQELLFLSIMKHYGQITSAPYVFYSIYLILYISFVVRTLQRDMPSQPFVTLPYFTSDFCCTYCGRQPDRHPVGCRSNADVHHCLRVCEPSRGGWGVGSLP